MKEKQEMLKSLALYTHKDALKLNKKRESGITLIALLITIIVLIILAAISINALVENNFINTAMDSTESFEREEQKELTHINDIEDILDKSGSIADNPGGGTDTPVISDASGANAPTGTIAGKHYVTWEWNDTTKEYDEKLSETQPANWYDYENGKWANIKTTNNGLEAYWVWIPRYEYVVPTEEAATQIELKFISKEQKIPDTDKNYVIHPAFTNEGNGGFGDLAGIWVAKYEAVSSTPTASDGGGNDKNLKVQVIPNQPSWRSIQTTNMFSVCRKMTGEGEALAGSTVDSHMMKNIEWGAVAILSQSKYGIFNPKSSTGTNGNKTYQIWNNPSSSYTTGSVGTSKDASNTAFSAYNSENGPKASTTGTIYGVYDMAGGAWEYVAGCLTGYETIGDSKYVDIYTNPSNSLTNYEGAKVGDATKETKGWNSDYCQFVTSRYPWFGRGRLLRRWHLFRCV